MSNCPICDSEYNEGQETCSTCSYPLNEDLQEIKNWARDLWQHFCNIKDKYNKRKEKENEHLFANLKAELNHSLNTKIQEINENLLPQIEQLKLQIQIIIEDQKNEQIEVQNIRKTINCIDTDRSRIEDIKNQLYGKFEANHSSTQERLDELQNKLEALEYNIRANNHLTRTTSNFSREFPEARGDVGWTSESDRSIESPAPLSIEESNLARRYNRDMVSFSQQATEVNATEDSLNKLRIGSTSNVIFESKRRGPYWIVRENGYDYLVPSNHLRLNQHNYKTVEDLFECINFKLDSNFQLVKPARVSPLPGGETWQLEERGILQF